MTTKTRLFAPYGLNLYQQPLSSLDVMGWNLIVMVVEAILLMATKVAFEYNLHSLLKR